MASRFEQLSDKLPILVGRLRFYLVRALALALSQGDVRWARRGWFGGWGKCTFRRGSTVRLGRIEALGGLRLVAEPGSTVEIGDGVFFNRSCTIVARAGVSIGSDTLFGEAVKIFDHDHVHRPALMKHEFVARPVRIGSGCWIGSNVVILKGITIGDNATIGANLVIREDVPAGVTLVQKQELVYLKK